MPTKTMRDGAALHYIDVGRGEPVVMLHGFGMHGRLWLPFVLRHVHRYRFILPDLRGFGSSHRLRLGTPTLLDQHADDLADLVDGLGLQSFHLAGLSMGACTALQYQRHYGFSRVRAYLHIDQSPCVRNDADWQWGLLGSEQDERLQRWAELLQTLEEHRALPFDDVPPILRRALWATLSEFYACAFHHRGWRATVKLARYERLVRRIAPTANWPVYLDCLRSYLHDDYDWRPTLPALQVPFTALVGMQSAMYPAQGQLALRDFVPHARIVPLDDCGHAIPFEAPLRFARELQRFLQQRLDEAPASAEGAAEAA